VFRGAEIVHRVEPHAKNAVLSDRVRIAWRGASAPGNFSRARMRWDGSAKLSGGAFANAAGYALDTPDEGIVSASGREIVWRSSTGGDWDGIEVDVAAPDDAILSVVTPQVSVAVPISRLRGGPASFADETPLRELELRFLPRDLGPSAWRGEFRDGAARPGWNAYWFRVRQWDGGIAWSSPIFVDLLGGPR
jgi:hypothetical protein